MATASSSQLQCKHSLPAPTSVAYQDAIKSCYPESILKVQSQPYWTLSKFIYHLLELCKTFRNPYPLKQMSLCFLLKGVGPSPLCPLEEEVLVHL